MDASWTAIVLTCCTREEALSYQKELKTRQKIGLIGEDVLLLTVEDPKARIGSGGATINALLVVTEYLSAKKGQKEIDYSILSSSRILIAHSGRSFLYAPMGRAFTPLPLRFSESYESGAAGRTTPYPSDNEAGSPETEESRVESDRMTVISNFDLLLEQVTTKLAAGGPPGVWVCSTDMVLQVGEGFSEVDWSACCGFDAVTFSVPGSVDCAVNHGVYRTKADGEVIDMLYQASREKLQDLLTLTSRDTLDLVVGVVFFSVPLAERLLRLHVVSPINMCTYLGLDSGAEPVEISLFHDIMYAMTEADSRMFKGVRKSPVDKLCWQLLKKSLKGSKFKLVSLTRGKFDYLHNRLSELRKAWSSLTLPDSLPDPITYSSQTHSMVRAKNPCEDLVTVNSKVTPCVSVGKGCRIANCCLDYPMEIGDGAELEGVCLENGSNLTDTGKQECPLLVIEKEMYLSSVHVRLQNSDSSSVRVHFLHGINDNIDLTADESEARFCGQTWEQFFTKTNISSDEIWPSNLPTEKHCLRHAKLFPVLSLCGQSSLTDILWMQPHQQFEERLIHRWRNSWRLSLADLQAAFHVPGESSARKGLSLTISLDIIRSVLLTNQERALGPIYASVAAADSPEFVKQALQCLDEVAMTCDSVGKAARTLANIADLLGAVAGNGGGLRSGPSGNPSWQPAYNLLEAGKIQEGVSAMAGARAEWLDRPDLLIRAARHYEGGAQILIRQAVSLSKKFMKLTNRARVPAGYWVVGEAPARLDIAGGWSDTPPITYEHGGAVTGVGIKIDGVKPVGAKVRAIEEFMIMIVLHLSRTERQTVEVKTLDDLRDYCRPEAPGALPKAAVCCTGIVDLNQHQSLSEQLRAKLGHGLELHTWAHLPRGSGLGTSSILAGCICAVLWRVSGKEYDNHTLIHAVLCVEQMLTTGGGWQDQVAGLVGGVKLGTSSASLPMKVDYKVLNISSETRAELGRRIVLIYTGKTRLAKNLLQNVVRCWYARDASVVQTEDRLVRLAHTCAAAFEKGDIPSVGRCASEYWGLKKRMAAGCETLLMTQLRDRLGPHTDGLCMAGAGGGGFVYAVMKKPGERKFVEEVLASIKHNEEVSVHDVEVDGEGLEISIVKVEEE